LLSRDELAFAPGCFVKYSRSGPFDDGNSLRAQVLLCQAVTNQDSSSSSRFSYTIMTFSNDQSNGFKVVKGVLSDEISYNTTSKTATAAAPRGTIQ
jgi:hypothetical protein